MGAHCMAPAILLFTAAVAIAVDEGDRDRAPKPGQAAPTPIESLEPQKTPRRHQEDKVPITLTLPDPLRCDDGTQVKTAEAWQTKRRAETLELFTREVYGRGPGKPAKIEFEVELTEPQALEGRATLRRVRITASDADGKSFAFETTVLVPNARNTQPADARRAPPGGPSPAFIFISKLSAPTAQMVKAQAGFWPVEEIIKRGYATAVYRTGEVDPDEKDPQARARGVRGVWPAGGAPSAEAPDAWATIAAWAWGASRVLDYLETLPEIDAKRVAVIGHSRRGKTALWAGASDRRFALAISNGSGRGGASLAQRARGESVKAVNGAFPHWFCANYKKYNGRQKDLPVDSHQLVALMAPRAVYVASADQDLWADPRGEFLSLVHASPVYQLFGFAPIQPDEMPPLDTPLARGPRGYHIRSGGHKLTEYDWQRYLDFADKLWK